MTVLPHGATQIKTYCETLAEAVGLTLDLPLVWRHTDLPAMEQPPYWLILSIIAPFTDDLQVGFTHEEIEGYVTGTTTAAVQEKIRTTLDACIREDQDRAGEQ